MSASWGYYLDPQDDAVSERTLQRAVELGVTHFDTATLYGRGHNEKLVGRALRNRPAEVLIASKCGLENRGFPTPQDRSATVTRTRFAGTARSSLEHGSGSTCSTSTTCTASIPDVPVEESFGALSELVGAGKIRRLGMSECTVDELARAHATHPRERAAERVLALDARAAGRRDPVVRAPTASRSWPSACSGAAS